jgi:hypothetical protein
MENPERDYKIVMFNEKLKAVLVELAVNDELPMDMTTLEASVFDPCTTPLVDALITLQEDAEWALEGKWDRTDSGFEAQIELINSVI